MTFLGDVKCHLMVQEFPFLFRFDKKG